MHAISFVLGVYWDWFIWLCVLNFILIVNLHEPSNVFDWDWSILTLSTNFKFIRPAYIVLILCNGCSEKSLITFFFHQSEQTEAWERQTGWSAVYWYFHFTFLCCMMGTSIYGCRGEKENRNTAIFLTSEHHCNYFNNNSKYVWKALCIFYWQDCGTPHRPDPGSDAA